MSDAAAILSVIEGGAADHRTLPAPSAPMGVARELVEDRYTYDGDLTLRRWRGTWWEWHGSHWAEVEDRAVKAAMYQYTEHASYVEGDKVRPWAPNRRKIADLAEALEAIAHTDDMTPQPAWLDGSDGGHLVACQNGLLDPQTRHLRAHSPRFFNSTAVPFEYDAAAPLPGHWLEFLAQLWPNDPQTILVLQEWAGYVVSGRTDLQKMLLMVGPTRGGKGVISRTLGKLVGTANVAAPTLSSLAGDFGVAPLLGKSLAVISDARLAGRGHHVVVERLLSISGEDWITVNRKYREQWTGQIPVRFMLVSNELPQLGDASAAIAGRFVPLLLEHSWLGREDRELERRLEQELPSILNWALEGLVRLDRRGKFTQTTSADDALLSLRDLASPVAAFVRDRCQQGPDEQIAVDDLWQAWRTWAEENGHGRGGTRQVFGRDLRASVPRLRQARVGGHDSGERIRMYIGISLREGS